MNKKDSGKKWLGVPVHIVDEDIGRVDIVTESRNNLAEPMFLVDQQMFDEIEKDFENNRASLDHMLYQFREGKIEPLNEAAQHEDEMGNR